MEQFEYANIAEWKTVVTGIDEGVYAEFEWQAHALAALLLRSTAELVAESSVKLPQESRRLD